MLTKPCGNPECVDVIKAKTLTELKRRKYCTHRCANRVSGQAAKRGHQDKTLWRACMAIQRAVGIAGDPSPELLRVVRLLRRTAYQAGWAVVVGKVRRSVARGVLVQRSHQKTEEIG